MDWLKLIFIFVVGWVWLMVMFFVVFSHIVADQAWGLMFFGFLAGFVVLALWALRCIGRIFRGTASAAKRAWRDL